MEEQEQKLKASLEGAVSRPRGIAGATWRRLWRGAVSEYLRGLLSWEELVIEVQDALDYQDDLDRERSGAELEDSTLPEPSDDEEEKEDPAVKLLSEQTKARARALSEFYAFRAGDDTPTRPMRVKLRTGGPGVFRDLEDPNSDPDIRQVIILEVQAWVPQEEVAKVYGSAQSKLLKEDGYIRHKPSTLDIAAFVWREWRHAREEGRDLPTWPELRQLWLKYHPGDKRIEGHGDFQKYFNRAKEAVFPKYLDLLFPAPPELKAEIEAMKARMFRRLSAPAKKAENAAHFENRPTRE